MDRRKTVLALLALATAPRFARAQRTEKTYLVGYLQVSSREQQVNLINAFEDGLRDHGYRVGQNIVIESRFADGKAERLPALATDLVRLNVNVIVTGNNPGTVAARHATTTIPIVMAAGTDPLGAGLVTSLARPNGNITGVTQDTGEEISGKRIELLKDAVLKLSRIAILWNPNYPFNQVRWQVTTDFARKLGLTPVSMEVRKFDDLGSAFDVMVKKRVNAIVVIGDPLMFSYRDHIGRLAIRHRLPIIGASRELAAAGFLLTYGADLRDLWRRAAGYVDKILKGAKPADLPIEQPTKFSLMVNLKTAKAMGITIPQSILARTDEVIQ